MATNKTPQALSTRRLVRIDIITSLSKTVPVQGGWRVVHLGRSLGVAPDRLYSSIRLVVAKALRFGKVI